jgi:hypothetical protein
VIDHIGNSSVICWAELDNATGYVWGRIPYLFTVTFDDTAAPQTFGENATPTETVLPTSQPSASNNTLSTAAIAGVSIGSVFCVLAIIIIVLLYRIARSRRPRGEKIKLNGTGLNRNDTYNAPEID